MFLWKNKKNINTFRLKKRPFSGAKSSYCKRIAYYYKKNVNSQLVKILQYSLFDLGFCLRLALSVKFSAEDILK